VELRDNDLELIANKDKKISYVLITPARNEEANIEYTISSVISQTVLPRKWVIVSDGSTDRTDAIVKGYLLKNSWIEFIRMPEHRDRQFAAKVRCFNAGYKKVKEVDFDIVGNLDADISFDREYFDWLLGKFEEDLTLGVAGTPFVEDGKCYDYRFTNVEHVSGACQLFRRRCFEEIGGYLPIRGGGVDWVAVTTARMRGWKTRTFTDKTCLHHRKMGTGNSSAIMTWFRQGRKDCFLGNHPLWEVFRVFYQMCKKPFLVGGGFLLIGYVSAILKRKEMPISTALMEFVRKEQMERLKNLFRANSLHK
jgi:cellulose synthase/poly-beta-1,6-N-acetylglucosamine synthase-like glycosyltransferase